MLQCACCGWFEAEEVIIEEDDPYFRVGHKIMVCGWCGSEYVTQEQHDHNLKLIRQG
jgi:hypothetical protein